MKFSADHHKAIARFYRNRAVTEPKPAEHFLERCRRKA